MVQPAPASPFYWRINPEVYRLVGVKCKSCGHITYPRYKICPACGGFELEEHKLSRRGTVHTFCINWTPPPGLEAPIVPVVVEAWASPADAPAIAFYVNRTPISAEIHASRCMSDKSAYGLMGCNLSNEHKNTAFSVKAGRGREYALVVNVTTPHLPVRSSPSACTTRFARRA